MCAVLSYVGTDSAHYGRESTGMCHVLWVHPHVCIRISRHVHIDRSAPRTGLSLSACMCPANSKVHCMNIPVQTCHLWVVAKLEHSAEVRRGFSATAQNGGGTAKAPTRSHLR